VRKSFNYLKALFIVNSFINSFKKKLKDFECDYQLDPCYGKENYLLDEYKIIKKKKRCLGVKANFTIPFECPTLSENNAKE
jgi:hypothetical protein